MADQPKPVGWGDMTQAERERWLREQEGIRNLPKNDISPVEEFTINANKYATKKTKAMAKAFPKGGKIVPMKGSPNMGMIVSKKKALSKALKKDK
jgi:hypothetical protein